MSAADDHTSYEPEEPAHPRWIAAGICAFVLFTAIAMLGLYFFYLPVAHEEPFKVTEFSPPRLQIDPSNDLARVDRAQRARLNRSGWLDRKKKVLAIPVGNAMKVIASRGKDAYAPLPNAPKPTASGRPAGAMAPNGRRFNPGAGKPEEMRGAQ